MRVACTEGTSSQTESWTLLGNALGPVESFLAYLMAIERAPNTVKAYAHDLRSTFTSARSFDACNAMQSLPLFSKPASNAPMERQSHMVPIFEYTGSISSW